MQTLATIETALNASVLRGFAVHAADNSDMACETVANYCQAMREHIAANGCPGVILLDVDTDRNLIQIADGNHRVNLCADNMALPVVIRFNSQVKRAYPKGVTCPNWIY